MDSKVTIHTDSKVTIRIGSTSTFFYFDLQQYICFYWQSGVTLS